jgi:HSP20 family molecular chaperone IbpA
MVVEPGENGDLPDPILRIPGRSGDSVSGRPVIFDIRIREPAAGMPGVSETTELEIHTFGDEVKCVGEFPGVSPGDVRIFFSGGRIMVVARDGERTFRAGAEVPPPDRSTISVSFRHGVLETGYRRLPGPEREQSH